MSDFGPGTPLAPTSAEERFQPTARLFRDRRRRFLRLMWSGIPLATAALFVSERFWIWLLAPGLLLIVAGMASAFAIPALRCPDCSHELERLDRFCPRCGEPAIERRIWRANVCRSCGKGLGTTRGRHFPVHHCSQCGVLVDRAGL